MSLASSEVESGGAGRFRDCNGISLPGGALGQIGADQGRDTGRGPGQISTGFVQFGSGSRHFGSVSDISVPGSEQVGMGSGQSGDWYGQSQMGSDQPVVGGRTGQFGAGSKQPLIGVEQLGSGYGQLGLGSSQQAAGFSVFHIDMDMIM